MANKLKKMQEKVQEELKHIPDWPDSGPQKELRMLYNMCRMRSLGKRAEHKQTAKEVLMKCISDLQPKYPGYSFKYDQDFFNKRA